MSPKYRMTGCARLFLFLLILIPVAYIAAAYISGNDPIATVKNLLDGDKTEIVVETDKPVSIKSDTKVIDKKNDEILELKEEIYNLNKELKQTKEELRLLKEQNTNNGN